MGHIIHLLVFESVFAHETGLDRESPEFRQAYNDFRSQPLHFAEWWELNQGRYV
jgi:hypothetical protein